jgi:hypothetical protein
MWGNRLGWWISACMMACAAALGLWVWSAVAITAPTDLSLNAQNMAPLMPPISIVAFDQPGDAGDSYRAALLAYDDSNDAYTQFMGKPLGNPPQAMQLVLDATHLSGMSLFTNDPAKIVNYDTDQASLDSLKGLADTMDGAGVRLKQLNKLADARRYFLAVYAMGFKLMSERLTYQEYSTGLGMAETALDGLSECESENSPHWTDLQQAKTALADFDAQRVTPIYQVLVSVDQQTIADNAGDIFAFATKSQERMFRVEAVLKLGRYRFDAARKADQMGASRYISRLSGDSDPAVRTAAAAGRDLTVEEYRMIH